jgi:hypothetical protein
MSNQKNLLIINLTDDETSEYKEYTFEQAELCKNVFGVLQEHFKKSKGLKF